jgi:type II secretory pathway pseudopilin PulG
MRLPYLLPSAKPVARVTALMAAALLVAATLFSAAQTAYQPKFKGDPARSESEANALGYMRTVIRAQKQYYKKNDKYAPTLSDLVHTGSFTRRMTETNRGDYTVTFHSRKDGYELTLTPKQVDPEHRAFYANEDGVIHADEQKAADENSPAVK